MPSTSLVLSLTFVAIHATLTTAVPVDNSGNAYSGKGGHASGGDVNSDSGGGLLGGLLGGGLLNILSNNAGDGGNAKSGNAIGGIPGLNVLNPKWQGRYASADNSGNAYSEEGGDAEGGSVKGPKGLINILSGNAGDGGDANSGSAIARAGGGSNFKHNGDGDGERDGGNDDGSDPDGGDRGGGDRDDGHDRGHGHDNGDDDCDC